MSDSEEEKEVPLIEPIKVDYCPRNKYSILLIYRLYHARGVLRVFYLF